MTATKSTPTEELLTKKDLAKALKTSTRTIEKMKGIPAYRWGRNVRYDLAEVLEFIKTGEAA